MPFPHPRCLAQLCELQFAAWRETLWSSIRTDEMEEVAKGFVKEVKGLNKKVGAQPAGWRSVRTAAYRGNRPRTSA
jgi:hypothetical protein